MDFLSKINANAGIDVKKGGCVVASIDNNRAEFTMSEFDVNAGGDLRIGNGCGAELNIRNGELNLCANAGYIKMNTEFIEFCSYDAPMSISYDSNHGINIRDNHATMAELSFNTEFFKLHYGEPSSNNNSGPAFTITSKLSNSYSDSSLPTAEIKSQRLNILAYSKNYNYPGAIGLFVTPPELVDTATKEPTHSHDVSLIVDNAGIRLDSGYNPDGNAIGLYTNGTDGLVDINTSNMGIFASPEAVDGKFVGGTVDIQSHVNGIAAGSFINMTTGGRDVNSILRPGASIRLSSGMDSTNTSGSASVKVKTTEFLVDLSNESSVQFNFGTGLKTNIDHSGINFSNNATIGIPASVGGRLTFCSNNMLFETNELAVSLINGGCMVFNNNGLNISTTPTGSIGSSGNVLLSQSLRNIERMTQSEYDALTVKNENTLYIIAG